MSVETEKPVLLLVDGHSLAFRSFYAFSKGGDGGLATKEGIPTSVTYGFLKSLLDNCISLRPKGVAIAFDTAEPTFRHKADINYKANRDVAPEIFFEDLRQLQMILEELLNLPLCIAPGYEADDVLGTLANKASDEGWKVRILSGDRDLFQLVDDQRNIAVLYMGGGAYSKSSGPTFIDESGVEAKLGVFPKKVVDLKALTGDSSDNIPGVKGVGPKTAINLLKENGDLDGIYSALSELESEGDKSSRGALKGAVKAKLKKDKDNAFLSRFLAEILIKVPLPEEPRLILGKVDEEALKGRLTELELNSLVRQIPSFVETFSKEGHHLTETKKTSTNEISEEQRKTNLGDIPNINPRIIISSDGISSLVKHLLSCQDPLEPVAIDTETTNINPFKAELVGIGISWGEGLEELCYIPIGHKSREDLLNGENVNQLPLESVLKKLSFWLSSPKHPKVLQNAKYDRLIFLRHGLELNGVVMDTLLADYLLDANAKHGLDAIARRELGFSPISFSDLVGKGETFADVDLDSASRYCGMDVHLTRILSRILREKTTRSWLGVN